MDTQLTNTEVTGRKTPELKGLGRSATKQEGISALQIYLEEKTTQMRENRSETKKGKGGQEKKKKTLEVSQVMNESACNGG